MRTWSRSVSIRRTRTLEDPRACRGGRAQHAQRRRDTDRTARCRFVRIAPGPRDAGQAAKRSPDRAIRRRIRTRRAKVCTRGEVARLGCRSPSRSRWHRDVVKIAIGSRKTFRAAPTSSTNGLVARARQMRRLARPLRIDVVELPSARGPVPAAGAPSSPRCCLRRSVTPRFEHGRGDAGRREGVGHQRAGHAAADDRHASCRGASRKEAYRRVRPCGTRGATADARAAMLVAREPRVRRPAQLCSRSALDRHCALRLSVRSRERRFGRPGDHVAGRLESRPVARAVPRLFGRCSSPPRNPYGCRWRSGASSARRDRDTPRP